MSNVSITFLGATETVTGSRFLVSDENTQILIDAGLFQGTPDIKAKNWEPFPVNPKEIDAVVLTHAHLDHTGYLPLLVKQGFSGPVYCTEYTAKLASVILQDSARIQAEDAKYAQKKGYSKHKNPRALYNEEDAQQAIKLFKICKFDEEVSIEGGAIVQFRHSGHILGSSFVTLNLADKKLLFTGDMGRPTHPVLTSPDAFPAEHFDAVISESTYGDRVHETPTEEFAEIINKTIARGGSVLIPAFAVDRTEVILLKLRELVEAGTIKTVPIFVDSPMALTALDFYREALNAGRDEIRPDMIKAWQGRDPFDPGTLSEKRTVEDSKSLNDVHTPCIIVSASGMATGGRVVHHLAHMLPDSKNTVLLVGYQANGTRGRQLENGEKRVRIHGEDVPVRAQIAKADAFSVHADGDELIAWLSKGQKPTISFVVHGELESAEIFAKRLKSELGWNAVVPKPEQSFDL
jgi:metallo-beta-lactamase family protein